MEILAADVLEKLSNHLAISTSSKPRMVIPSDPLEFALVGRTAYSTGQERKEIIAALSSKWKHFRPEPKILEVTDEIFIVRFRSPAQLKIALENGPWRIFGQVFLLKKLCLKIAPKDYQFETFSIWFTFEDLPFNQWRESRILRILKNVTPVSGIFPEHSFPLNNAGYRIRTTIDYKSPLPLGMGVKNESGGKQFVFFLFENLPAYFCNYCRLIGHKMNCCPNRLVGVEGVADTQNILIEAALVNTIMNEEDLDSDGSPMANNVLMNDVMYSPTRGLLPRGELESESHDLGCIRGPSEAQEWVDGSVKQTLDMGSLTRLAPIGTPFVSVDHVNAARGNKHADRIDAFSCLPLAAMNRIQEFLPASSSNATIDPQAKGKRIMLDESLLCQSSTGTKRSRLESIVENMADAQEQEEIRNLFVANAHPSNIFEETLVQPSPIPDFLGAHIGDLAAVVNSIQSEQQGQQRGYNDFLRADYVAVNEGGPNLVPHQVSIMRVAELLPSISRVTRTLKTVVTRYSPYHAQYSSGGRLSGRLVNRRAISDSSANSDRTLDLFSLNVDAGPRQEVQELIELPQQRQESVAESDPQPCGPTA